MHYVIKIGNCFWTHENNRIYLLSCYRTFLKKATEAYSNCGCIRRKNRGETSSSTTYSDTSDSVRKRRERYVDHTKYTSKPTCLINGPGHSSDECRFFREFSSNYSKIRPIKDHNQDPETKTIDRQK